MGFGQIMRRLRSGADMTQERLADLLNISPQAVSRWENDAAMPDISLLRPLANLFGVTTDYLLEMDTFQKDARRKEFEERSGIIGRRRTRKRTIRSHCGLPPSIPEIWHIWNGLHRRSSIWRFCSRRMMET